MRRLLIVPAVVVLGIFPAIAAQAASSSAQIVDCAASTWCFSPNPITVPVGATITWTNTTTAPHSATSNTGAWTTGTIAPGATSGRVAFMTAGTFAYHCAVHPFMTGSVIVTAATAASAAPRATVAKGLAQSGAGPMLPVGALVALLGLAFLTPAVWRRRPRER